METRSTEVRVERLAQLVRQHAETARLLGVNFVPVYRSPGSTIDTPSPGPVPTQRTEPAPTTPRPAVAIEPKPMSLGAAAGGRSREQVQARLDDLYARFTSEAPYTSFENHSHNVVFGEGDPLAALMFVGEAPGEEEDRQGRPFVGRAGQLLDKMIAAMGLARGQVYICNVLKTRPPNNATPTPEEAAACEPCLLEQIMIIAPRAIVTLGKSAAQCLLKTQASMSSLRGQWHELWLPDATMVPVMPTFHPSYVLRTYTPEVRQKVWSDLRLAMERLGLTPPAKTEA